MPKFALITGSSGGIGAATAEKLASNGWNLYLHYHSNENKVRELMANLHQYNVELIPIFADLTKEEGVKTLINNIFQINAIVYSSGTAPYGLFSDLDEQTINDMIQLHIKSPLLITKHLQERLLRFPYSHIVLISSIWGQTGAACEVMYSTVKGAQIAFIKAISKELARNGTRVNGIAPGAVKTNMLNRFSEDELSDLEMEIPMGRLAEPEEIANVVSFLLSKESSYITGQILGVNGGWYT